MLSTAAIRKFLLSKCNGYVRAIVVVMKGAIATAMDKYYPRLANRS